ncbi:16S rRNA (cytidine(1402)-2'-O)-methyltransferase [Candidatus Falkowbacteria bacterium]|jgi:16S rRNA (cytidine1402-2'-O)-methyltransferase|nr:16S rRNA (cytidine(1402)-2'-O)-methyltransferase [Candidatus Falkowbacteria bacterium]MBT7007808.1 16S rRNA (cytidine(1402)-2'-O)-methyltransferase [Candidatus Falkowbacteria bacterium]
MKELYIIATPIGNLKDITLRALDVLKEVDLLLCEDTRVTQKLLNHYEIKVKTVSLHQHSTDSKIKSLLEQYDKIGYASDAGTPGISDPGGKVAEIAYDLDFEVFTIPGPSAITSAISICGFPTDKFLFLGFMPHKGKTKIFNQIKESPYTACFYESPHRIMKTLVAMKDFVADRQIMIGRELTKKFESVYRGTIDEVIEQVEDKQKGEFVVIVSK